MTCANQLKQIGLALHQHHGDYSLLPSNGGWDGRQWIRSTDGRQTYVSTNRFIWGVGQPRRQPREQTGSWTYASLAYIEQDQIYQARDWRVPLKHYICPSRRPVVAQAPESDEHGTYNGGGWVWGKTDYAANGEVIANRPRCLRLGDIQDGTSHTLLIGEKGMDTRNYTKSGWFFDEPFFLGGSHGTFRTRPVLRPDSMGGIADRWGAAHASGAQFLFGDGSVRLVSYGTSEGILQALMTPAGSEVVPEF
jgi:prepilin-type processing-associated H-X9-DG protein